MTRRICSGAGRIPLTAANAAGRSYSTVCTMCGRRVKAMTHQPMKGWPYGIVPPHLTPGSLAEAEAERAAAKAARAAAKIAATIAPGVSAPAAPTVPASEANMSDTTCTTCTAWRAARAADTRGDHRALAEALLAATRAPCACPGGMPLAAEARAEVLVAVEARTAAHVAKSRARAALVDAPDYWPAWERLAARLDAGEATAAMLADIPAMLAAPAPLPTPAGTAAQIRVLAALHRAYGPGFIRGLAAKV